MLKLCMKDYDENLHMTIETPAEIEVNCRYQAVWVDSVENREHEVCCYDSDCDFCDILTIEKYFERVNIIK